MDAGALCAAAPRGAEHLRCCERERGSLGDRFNIYPTANANQDLMPEEEAWPDSVIHPMDPWYSTWWTVTVIASAITALTVPVDVAFYQSQSVTYRFTGNFLFISWLVLELCSWWT
eukprot:jgi/Tetstr1/429299/TSEL_019217.t1